MSRYVVVGAGIVGLATAREILVRRPGSAVVVLDKEPTLAAHQTGRNSGVIHSGLYYAPGSLKARTAVAGARSMVAYARDRGVPVEVCGKIVVATDRDELGRLAALAERGRANGVPVREVGPAEIGDLEPHVRAIAGLHVASTGITDYRAVCAALAEDIAAAGGQVRLATAVVGFARDGARTLVQTTRSELAADVVVTCAGLQADRLAALDGQPPPARIVPFRGEYFSLRPDSRHLVRNLVYPVPDPRFPFLGVHFTRGVDGGVHVGPNAVPALAREGYAWSVVRPRDVAATVAYPGFWRLARTYLGTGTAEIARSASRHRFADSARRLVPDVADDDLVPSPSGVRAQALTRDGSLVDDFLFARAGGRVHVLNAPSPAATASLEIARLIVDDLP